MIRTHRCAAPARSCSIRAIAGFHGKRETKAVRHLLDVRARHRRFIDAPIRSARSCAPPPASRGSRKKLGHAALTRLFDHAPRAILAGDLRITLMKPRSTSPARHARALPAVSCGPSERASRASTAFQRLELEPVRPVPRRVPRPPADRTRRLPRWTGLPVAPLGGYAGWPLLAISSGSR